MPAITVLNLRQFAPGVHANIIEAFTVPNADDVLIDAGIKTRFILANFMGQTFVETNGYRTLTENLYYTPERLVQVFGISYAKAVECAGNPVKTADLVYGNRMGNTKYGDGWKYRGGGLIDLTGSDNYKELADKTGIDIWNHPDLIRDPQTALLIAAQCFNDLGAVEAAANDDERLVTFRINGGYNAEAQRRSATRRAYEIFKEVPVSTPYKASSSSYGFLPHFENVSDEPPDSYEETPAVAVSARVPLTMEQAKLLQNHLKEKNYSPGEIDGNIDGPSTVGAVAELQKQQGIPVTGVVDDVTEDAIQNASPKVVSEDRASETAGSLRSKGSATIHAADNINLAAHGVSAAGVGTLGVGASGIFAAVNNQADQVKKITDHVPGLSEKFAVFVTGHISIVAVIAFGVGLLYLATRLYENNRVVISERIRKSRSGEDMSH